MLHPRAALPLALALVACSSTPEKAGSGALDEETSFRTVEAWSRDMVEIDRSTGILLADLDRSLRAWHKLYLTGRGEADLRTARALEDDIAFQATKHQDVLIEQLESGPPANRRVAAIALGFSRQRVGFVTGLSYKDEGAPSEALRGVKDLRRDPLPPLLAALDDPVEEVAANAAVGLGVLARKETPTGGLVGLLEAGADPTTRSNAAFALFQISQAGGGGDEVRAAARRGLHDPEPGVRAQCATITAQLLDVDAIEDLGLLLYDDETFPIAAAARSLAYIGEHYVGPGGESAKGRCARALAGALGKAGHRARGVLLSNLIAMAKKNYGNDEDEDWLNWAHGLP